VDDKNTVEEPEKTHITAEELREARKAAGLSMVKAAEYSDTPYRTWQDWEGDKRRVPGIAMAWLDLYVKLRVFSHGCHHSEG